MASLFFLSYAFPILFFFKNTDARPACSPKALHEEDEEEEEDGDDEITVATALSNATTTKSADEKEERKEVSQLDLVFVVRAWLGCVCVGVCGRCERSVRSREGGRKGFPPLV